MKYDVSLVIADYLKTDLYEGYNGGCEDNINIDFEVYDIKSETYNNGDGSFKYDFEKITDFKIRNVELRFAGSRTLKTTFDIEKIKQLVL